MVLIKPSWGSGIVEVGVKRTMQGVDGAEDLGRLRQLWFCLAWGWGAWSWHPSEDPGSWLSWGLSGATDLGSPLSESVVPSRQDSGRAHPNCICLPFFHFIYFNKRIIQV